jgi:hypothetical protein
VVSESLSRYVDLVGRALRACDTTCVAAPNQETAPRFHEQEKFMSKLVLVAGFAAVVSLGACAKHSGHTETVAAPEPIPAPVYVEPVATKKY